MNKAIVVYESINNLTNLNQELSLDRQKKVESFRYEDDKKRCILGELLLKRALKEYGIRLSKISYKYNEYGKPYLNDCDLFFNISHSKDYVVCVVSNIEVGIDIQEIREIDLRIAEKEFTNYEYGRIVELDNKKAQLNQFYDCWTKKEAYTKAIGLGMKYPFKSFDVIENDTGYLFTNVDIDNHYKCVIASKDPIKLIAK